MYELLLPHSRAKNKVTALFDRYHVGPLDEDVNRQRPDATNASTDLEHDQLLDLLWIERFDAMFADHSLILGEAVSIDGAVVPVAWHDGEEEWISFNNGQ